MTAILPSDFADILEQVVVLLRKSVIDNTNVVDTTYPANFITAVGQVLVDEGGYSNDPDDPGGETNFGIDKRTYPNVDIRNLTRDGAIKIYYTDWWQKYRLDLFPNVLANKMLNVGVNTGMSQAVKFLQRAAGAPADGVIGPITRGAAGKADPGTILQSIRDQQKQFYINLVNARPVLGKFLNGWLTRAAE